jgi:hypothetical protein
LRDRQGLPRRPIGEAIRPHFLVPVSCPKAGNPNPTARLPTRAVSKFGKATAEPQLAWGYAEALTYVPNIGTQPEPPEQFNVNVQALVYNVDILTLKEVPTEHVNLNQQIAVETALPPPSLDKTFGNDIVAIDGDLDGNKFLTVSRGGNQVIRAKLDASGKLNILDASK